VWAEGRTFCAEEAPEEVRAACARAPAWAGGGSLCAHPIYKQHSTGRVYGSILAHKTINKTNNKTNNKTLFALPCPLRRNKRGLPLLSHTVCFKLSAPSSLHFAAARGKKQERPSLTKNDFPYFPLTPVSRSSSTRAAALPIPFLQPSLVFASPPPPLPQLFYEGSGSNVELALSVALMFTLLYAPLSLASM
jgi:hypothetical protein